MMIVNQINKIPREYVLDDEENDRYRFSFKVRSLFQIMYYHTIHGRHKTQTHVMNACTVYKECKSREVIIDFNKQCMFISYKSVKY